MNSELQNHLKEIQEAGNLISEVVRKTPVLASRTLSEMSGTSVLLKLENLQRTGSFKIRGAYHKIQKIRKSQPELLQRGVVTASAGNHAQGVALGASHASIPATIVMAQSSPLAKVEATRRYGAKVVLKGHSYDEAYQFARQIEKEENLFFIHPFDDEEVIHGQGTVGLELLDQVESLDVVVVPIGGGGLISGIALAVKALAPKIRVIGVQSSTMNPAELSKKQGKRVLLPQGYTMAEGIGVKQIGERTWKYIDRFVDEVVSVPDEEIASGIALLLERGKIVAEGAGAAWVAAVIHGRVRGIEGKNVACVLSGGNIDISLFRELADPSRGRPGAPHSSITLHLLVTSKASENS